MLTRPARNVWAVEDAHAPIAGWALEPFSPAAQVHRGRDQMNVGDGPTPRDGYGVATTAGDAQQKPAISAKLAKIDLQELGGQSLRRWPHSGPAPVEAR